MSFRALGSEEEIYSIFGGIRLLWVDGNPVLATIVFVFSMVFPAVKLLLLGVVWWRNDGTERSRSIVRRLQLLGKWSMLDVLLIGLFVGSIRLGIATAESRVGIHVFTAAILLSMLATQSMGARVRAHLPLKDDLRARGALGRVLHVVAAALLVVALSSVLLVVRKALLFTNAVDLLSTTRELFQGDERTLALLTAGLVVAGSVARTLASGWLRWAPKPTTRAARRALFLEEWAMIDVFALALVIVSVKLDQLATVDLRLGFWATIAAAVFAAVDAWWLRRQVAI